MNCKPGDLAVVVGECEISGDYLIGRVFRLTTAFREDGEYYWGYEGPTLMTQWGSLDGIADDNLRPIRDPGDDARDETLSWKPVPKEDDLSKEDAELLIEALRQWAKEQA